MKQIKEVNDTLLFDQMVADTPQDIKIYISRSLEIAQQIISYYGTKKTASKGFGQESS